MKKTAILFFLLCLIFFGLCVISYAEPLPVRVYDMVMLFDAEEYASLEEQISQLQGQTGMDVIVVTTDNADGKSSMEYADDFYDCFGTGTEYNGVLLLIDMDNREVYISTSGKMIDYLTDNRIEAILEDIVPSVGNREYYAAAAKFLDNVAYYYETGVPEGQYRQDEYGNITRYRSITPGELIISAIIALAVGVGGVLIVYFRYQKPATAYRYPFGSKSRVKLTAQEDILINRTVTQRHIDTSHGGGSGSGGGRSSTHTSSSGRSHGGGGRKF